jgi:hypothetical protein
MHRSVLRLTGFIAACLLAGCACNSSVPSGNASTSEQTGTDGGGAGAGTTQGGTTSSGGGQGSGTTESPPVWKSIWVRTFGGESFQYVNAVADRDGNVIVGGRFLGPTEIGGQMYDSSTGAAFVAKLDGNGDLLWSKVLNSKASDALPVITGLVASNDGSVALSGIFDNTIDFGNGPLESEGSEDSFLVKLASDGAVVWTAQMSGSNGDQDAYGLAAGAEGSLIVVGRFESKMSLSGAALEALDGRDGWAAKYSKDGKLAWIRQFGGMGDQQAEIGGTDSSGDIVLTGLFIHEINLGDTTLAADLPTGFLAKIRNLDGSTVWGHAVDTTELKASLRPDDKIVLGGLFTGALTLGDQTYQVGPTKKAFVALSDKNGAVIKSRLFDADVAVPPQASFTANETVLSIRFKGALGVGDKTYSSLGSTDILLLGLDSNLSDVWGQQFGGAGQERGDPAFGPSGEMVLGGAFENSVNFGSAPIFSKGGLDGFAAKLVRVAPPPQ